VHFIDKVGFETGVGLETIERWLTIQVSSESCIDASHMLEPLAGRTPAQRLRLLQSVLERTPALARVARRLPLADQLRLSLLVASQRRLSNAAPQRASLSVAPIGAVVRCVARQRGRPR
jgi:hypothetical protein